MLGTCSAPWTLILGFEKNPGDGRNKREKNRWGKKDKKKHLGVSGKHVSRTHKKWTCWYVNFSNEYSVCVYLCVCVCFSSLEDFFAGEKLTVSNGILTLAAFTTWRKTSEDGDSHVGPQEFIDGCLRLKGPARSIDVQH